MELQLETFSIEMIKPSTPTPPHLKSFKLSLLDQFFGLTYVPHVLFYYPPQRDNDEVTNNQTSIISLLKESLSKTLSLFYPFAGRLTIDESSIDCNDKGISFVEARILNCSLNTFLEASNRVDLVGHFLSQNVYDQPIDPNSHENINKVTELVPLTIQVTKFNCGGLVIASQWLHKLCDATSWGNFLNNWASIAQGIEENGSTPDIITANSLFPPSNNINLPLPRKARTLHPIDENENSRTKSVDECIVRAFVFTPQAISALQDMAKSEHVPNPSRVEAVSGFIWKHAMAAAAIALASSLNSTLSGPSILAHAVNMRPRTYPPLQSTSFGNLFLDSFAYYEGENQSGKIKPDLSNLVARIRKGLAPAKNATFLSKFQGERGAEILRNYKQKLANLINNNNDNNLTTYKFTSWSGLDMFPNFVFGLPIWVGFAGGRLNYSFKNVIPLLETLDHGIEAWMILDEQEGRILQSDPEFRKFACLSYCP